MLYQLDLPFWDEGECECPNWGWEDCVCDLDVEAALEAALQASASD